jgi:hypothetical protein
LGVRPISPTVAVLALALAVLLAGCGSYTKRDFAAGANAICASTVRATRALTPAASGQSSTQELRALSGYLDRLVPLLESESKQIHALKRPAGSARERELLTRYLAALTESVAQYKQLAAAAGAGDARAAARAEAVLEASPVTSLASRYGLRSCAAPGATVS